MRETKFRAWDKINKQWAKIDIFDWAYSRGPGAVIVTPGESKIQKCDYLELCDCEQFTWLQYTGLKDKNGKEIYEGDIVKFLGVNCEIWWQYAAGYWAVDMKKYLPKHLENDSTFMKFHIQMEVIGTIYENPELLEEER